MRIALIGTSRLAVATARQLIARGHEVMLIATDRQRLEQLADSLDCAFVLGDGSKPAVLKDLEPETVDVLLGLTEDDQDNILSALVGRSLGFKRVIPKIEDAELQPICAELGLDETISPEETFARQISDVAEGDAHPDMSAVMRHGARFVEVAVGAGQAENRLEDLDLPDATRVACLYRDDTFLLPDAQTRLRKGDALILVTDQAHYEQVCACRDAWGAAGSEA